MSSGVVESYAYQVAAQSSADVLDTYIYRAGLASPRSWVVWVLAGLLLISLVLNVVFVVRLWKRRA